MAIWYKCDRCGKFVHYTYESGKNNAQENVFYISSSKMDPDEDYHDLCHDCYESFLLWWSRSEIIDELIRHTKFKGDN